jgi:chaperonin cofactor prefoldin
MLTTTTEEEEEESKPLLLRGERATTTTRRNHPKAFFALLFLVVVVSSALFAVHFSSSSLSSSDRLGVGIPHGEEETTKLGEVNDVSTDANDDAKAQEEEEDKDAAPKPENHEEKEVVETEDEEKVEKLIAKENELSEEVKTEMTDWKGEVEEQHKEIVDAVQILTKIEDDDDVAKATGSVDDAVAKVHKAQALIKDAVAAPPKIEKESEEIDGITQEIEEEIDNTDSTPSFSSTVTPEEAEAKMEALREHISTKQAEITKACDDISAAKAAMLDGSLAKEEGLKQIIANAEIISTSEASVYEEFHAVTKETESAPKGQTEAPSSPSDTDNN